MNDPEMTMFKDVSNSILVAHTKVPEAAYIAIKLALGVPAPLKSVSYTHLTLPTTCTPCRSRGSPGH